MSTLIQATTSFGFDFEKEREYLRLRAEKLRFVNNNASSPSSLTSTLSSNKFRWGQVSNDDFFQLNFDNDDQSDNDHHNDNDDHNEEIFKTFSCNIASMKSSKQQQEFKDSFGFPIGDMVLDVDFNRKISIENDKILNNVPLVYIPSAPLYLNNTHTVIEEGEYHKIVLQMQSFLNKQNGLSYTFTKFNCTWHINYTSIDNQQLSFEINLFKGIIENTHIMNIRYFEGQSFLFCKFYNKLRNELASKSDKYNY